MIRIAFTHSSVAVPNYSMQAITIWQPWASLIVAGLKEYETRGWQPSPKRLKVGDPIAIHAAKREPERIAELWPYVRTIVDVWSDLPTIVDVWSDLPTGRVLGYGYFQGAIKTDDANVSRQERKLGDWSPGRYAWKISDLHVFTTPVLATGKQGLWEWTP